MNSITLFTALSAILLFSFTAFAADGKVTISAPANGAMVNTSEIVMVTYDAILGDTGDHLHLYLDGKRIDVLRPIKGSAEVGMLSPGNHRVCLEINTKSHVSTGVESCIDLTAK